MPDTNLLLFVTASLALIVVPGSDMIYVLTSGISQGRTARLVSAVGVCSGLQVHTAFAALGLSVRQGVLSNVLNPKVAWFRSEHVVEDPGTRSPVPEASRHASAEAPRPALEILDTSFSDA